MHHDVYDENLEGRSGAVTVINTAKQVKKDEKKFEEALVEEIRKYLLVPCENMKKINNS